MNKKVLLIGGAESQCHAVDILNELNATTIVVDADETCLGSKLADEFYKISTNDVDRITSLAKEKAVDLVMAVQSDLGMITAAKVSSNLGLKSIPLNIARLFTDKSMMRDFLAQHNFLYPKYAKCKNSNDIENFISENGYPFVIKPLDSQGSRGVRIINSKDELGDISESEKFNRDTEGVIVESYLGNDEYTVEGIVISGKHYTLAVSQKTHYENLNCVSKELYYSMKPEYEAWISTHNSLIEATGIPFGITHSEYIKNHNGYTLVEFAARGGGSMISSHIVPVVSGWDVEKLYIYDLLGIPFDKPSIGKNCAVLKFIELQEKKIKSINGVDTIKSMSNVLFFHLSYNEGDTVMAVSNDTNRHGYYIAWEENEEKLNKLMQLIEETLDIKYED